MLKHTSGPWVAIMDMLYAKADKAGNITEGWRIETATGSTVRKIADIGPASPAEAYANALLISLAPELLETLKAIKARIDGEWDNPALMRFGPLNTNSDTDILAMVEEAIAKVEGRK